MPREVLIYEIYSIEDLEVALQELESRYGLAIKDVQVYDSAFRKFKVTNILPSGGDFTLELKEKGAPMTFDILKEEVEEYAFGEEFSKGRLLDFEDENSRLKQLVVYKNKISEGIFMDFEVFR